MSADEISAFKQTKVMAGLKGTAKPSAKAVKAVDEVPTLIKQADEVPVAKQADEISPCSSC